MYQYYYLALPNIETWGREGEFYVNNNNQQFFSTCKAFLLLSTDDWTKRRKCANYFRPFSLNKFIRIGNRNILKWLCFPSPKIVTHVRRRILQLEDFIRYCGTTALPLVGMRIETPLEEVQRFPVSDEILWQDKETSYMSNNFWTWKA